MVLKNLSRILVFVFFAVYLFIGISIFKDYGISWDEPTSRNNGLIATRYAVHGDRELLTYVDKYYGTAFEILSIDIADVDVGENIGAKLQTDQAEADKRIAQAKAEERRAMAVAKEQEMKALTQEMQARVVEAEAELPKAMAQAFREGNLGVMDYFNLRNVQADTKMRDSISGTSPEQKTEQ